LRFDELEVAQIDGRTALAWMEAWEDNGLHEVTFRSVIPYDTITYVVEFMTSDPIFKSHPDSIRAVVASFAIGRTEWNMPLVAVGVVASLMLFRMAAPRLRSDPYNKDITLFTLPVEDDDGDQPGQAGQMAQRDQVAQRDQAAQRDQTAPGGQRPSGGSEQG
jgi:hypothetical protein